MNQLLQILKEEISNSKSNKFIIGIDGKCASGKTTLAEKLAEQLDATIFHIDDYFIPKNKLSKTYNYNFDLPRFKKEIINNLSKDFLIHKIYQCKNDKFLLKRVKVNYVIIIEGSYSLNKQFLSYYNYKILTDTSYENQIVRLKNRNPQMFENFLNKWIPLENRYFENENIKNLVNYIYTT